MHFSELVAAARRLAFSAEAPDSEEQEDTAVLCDLLLRAYAAGIVELHLWAPRLVTQISDRPVASPVARLENRLGKRVTTLRHTGLELSDQISRTLLELLDGTRDFEALVDSLAGSIGSGKAQIQREGEPVTEPAQVRSILASELPLALNASPAARFSSAEANAINAQRATLSSAVGTPPIQSAHNKKTGAKKPLDQWQADGRGCREVCSVSFSDRGDHFTDRPAPVALRQEHQHTRIDRGAPLDSLGGHEDQRLADPSVLARDQLLLEHMVGM